MFEPIFEAVFRLIQIALVGGLAYLAYKVVRDYDEAAKLILLIKTFFVCVFIAFIAVSGMGKTCIESDPWGCNEYEYSEQVITYEDRIERFTFTFLLFFIPALCAWIDRRKEEI